MIIRTEAIVLHALDYGETSRIVSLMTRQQGRVSVMARGARRPKSVFGSALQPLSYTQVLYYYKSGRDLQTLKDATHAHRLRFLIDDMVKLSVGFRMIELVRALTEPGDPQPALFNALLHSLLHLDAATARAANVLPHFQLRLAGTLGFAPTIEKPAVAGLPEDGGVLDLSTGSIHSGGRGPSGSRASRSALRSFAVFARADLETALRMRISERVYDETVALVDAYLRYHVHGRYPDRAATIGRQLRSGISSGNT
jgi:DNA repair protein RecO (recombination protein O)